MKKHNNVYKHFSRIFIVKSETDSHERGVYEKHKFPSETISLVSCDLALMDHKKTFELYNN